GNGSLVYWILRTIDPKIIDSIPFHDDARRLWSYLEKRFCIANGPRIQQLRAQIVDCRQSKSMTIEEYYNKLIGLYDELNCLKPLHVFSCDKCTCDVVGKFTVDRQEEIFHQFIIGVDDDYYSGVRTNLLSQSPPPADLDKAYQALILEERSRKIAREKVIKEETHAFSVQNSRPWAHTGTDRGFDRLDESGLFCTHCNQRGHDRSSCFELHGKPQWYLDLLKRRSQRIGPVDAPHHTPTATHTFPIAASSLPHPTASSATPHVQHGLVVAARAHAVYEPSTSHPSAYGAAAF
ncbi:Transcription factor BYE1, partial [Bienertia sinuspersici]